jgi:hypothetical protein
MSLVVCASDVVEQGRSVIAVEVRFVTFTSNASPIAGGCGKAGATVIVDVVLETTLLTALLFCPLVKITRLPTRLFAVQVVVDVFNTVAVEPARAAWRLDHTSTASHTAVLLVLSTRPTSTRSAHWYAVLGEGGFWHQPRVPSSPVDNRGADCRTESTTVATLDVAQSLWSKHAPIAACRAATLAADVALTQFVSTMPKSNIAKSIGIRRSQRTTANSTNA